MHAHTKCFADNSLPFDDTPDTERPRTELKLWQEKRAESRHLLPPASAAPIKRQRDTSLALCDVRRTEGQAHHGAHARVVATTVCMRVINDGCCLDLLPVLHRMQIQTST